MNIGEASPDSHSNEGRKKSRLRRTLLGAAIGALLAMSMVPYVRGHRYAAERGYLPIYEIGARADVNVAQLILNVSFAGLIGALAFNLSRRVLLNMLLAVAVVAVVLGIWGVFSVFQEHVKAGAEREEASARFEIQQGNLIAAKQHLLKASNYWWWKGWWDGARDAKDRALDQQGMNKQAAVFRAQKDEERAMQLLGITNPFEQFDSKGSGKAIPAWAKDPIVMPAPESYPSDANVNEAKRVLLDAAEKWHAAGNTAEEQRVKSWEKNVITKAQLLASLPDQRWPGKYVSTDPNFGLKGQSGNGGFDPSKTQQANGDTFDQIESEQEKKLVHDPIDYQWGKWTTSGGEAFVVAKFFERNLGDRKPELDRLAYQLGAQNRYTLIEKQKRGGVWWVRVFLYKQ